MRAYRIRNRLLEHQPTRKRRRRVWPLLAVSLLVLNVYLFGIRGLPRVAEPDTGQRPRAEPAAAHRPGPQPARSARGLGEMRGVAGVRNAQDPNAVRRSHRARWGSQRSGRRFELERAEGVAGQRSLAQWCHRLQGAVQRGDGFSKALARSGLVENEIFSLVKALKPVFDFRHCRAGDRFEMLLSPKGRLYRFAYHESPLVTYRVERRRDALSARREEQPAEVELTAVAVRIEDSLWQSLAQAGESGALVMMIVDIFAWDIDFYLDTHTGDTIRLLVEKTKAKERFVRYGRILAAEYQGAVGVHRAFWYESQGGTRGYFDEAGDSLRKAFLKSPLKFARISSRYGMRVHPILGFDKMHQGVDFSAPVGTPVWAPADGTVIGAGRMGPSGLAIKLRHANGYSTFYAHLRRIAKGVRRGARVRQKQIIGAVGNTGRSTGPHLHYGMKLRGRHINPVGQRFPPAEPVPRDELDAYKRSIGPLQKKLQAIDLPAADTTASAATVRKDAG